MRIRQNPLWLRNPEETSLEIQNKGTSGPKNGHVSAKNFFFKKKKKNLLKSFQIAVPPIIMNPQMNMAGLTCDKQTHLHRHPMIFILSLLTYFSLSWAIFSNVLKKLRLVDLYLRFLESNNAHFFPFRKCNSLFDVDLLCLDYYCINI